MRTCRAAVLSSSFVAAVFILMASGPSSSEADVRLPAIFGDHMVLQRDQPLPVWGWAEPGEKITVSLGSDSAEAVAGADGQWRVTLGKRPAEERLELTISGKNTVTFKDVAVGEVWACSGQSNMEWPVSAAWNADLALEAAGRPNIRLITVPNRGSQEPMDDFPGKWEPCEAGAVSQFSAVGYYFGKRLSETLGVPVGLIDNAWGGSACEAWTPRKAMADHGDFVESLDEWVKAEAELDEEAAIAEYEKQIARWAKQAERDAAAGRRPRERPRARGKALGNQRPGNLFNTRVEPVAPYAIRGVIWYQGESNANKHAAYRELFPLMIQSWRDTWGQGDFSFYWVQLADFKEEANGPQESDWAALREAQTMTLDRLPNTGQAVIIDIGEAADIHPRNKQEVANRLARWALAKDYGLNVAFASPRFDSMTVAKGKAKIAFKDVTKKLRTVDQQAVCGFVIRGGDGAWHTAKAKIVDGKTVEVWSPEVDEPVAVRYAWADNPVCNLYDSTGLPVTPFRTDE